MKTPGDSTPLECTAIPDFNNADTALQCWHIAGPYPDSCEDHYDDYVLTPPHWDEAQVQHALIGVAVADDRKWQ